MYKIEEMRYVIYDNINKGFLECHNGFCSAPDIANIFATKDCAERELIINEGLSNNCVIKKCKITYEIMEETEEEKKEYLERKTRRKDTNCDDCFFETSSYEEGQDCSNQEISEKLKKRFCKNEEPNCPYWENRFEMD